MVYLFSFTSTLFLCFLSPVLLFLGYSSEFGEAKRWFASHLPLPNHSHSSKWIPPPPGIVKINVDAAWSDASKACGLGVVLRDHLGAVVGGSIRSDMCGSALVAEAKAILDGVNYALQHDITKVIMESDALEVVSEIQSKRKNKNWMTYPLIEEIRRKSLRFSEISWDWIPRKVNAAAHTAASLAKETVGLHRWASTPPPSLLHVLKSDGLPCPPAL